MTLRHERGGTSHIQIRKGDNVKVITGKDAGKSGRVLSINAKNNTVVVEHVGIIKRHNASQPFERTLRGGIVEKEAGINVSNVLVVCGSCGKHTRIDTRFAGRHEVRVAGIATRRGQVKDKVEEAMKSRLQEKYRSETVRR